MQETWRWFGPDDTVSLNNIVQAGASGVVTSLHHIATGEVWPLNEVLQRKKEIEQANLQWSVVESVPVHNDIKSRSGNYQQLIENYKASIKAVGQAGIKVICYNFMPVVDWTRTNLAYDLNNASQALRFEMTDFVAYDVYILKRQDAEKDYTPELVEKANERFTNMTDLQKVLLEKNIIAGLPGGEGSYNRDSIRTAFAKFTALGTEGLRSNFFEFLKEIIPVAEEAGVRMCVHPDDPPFPLFGLPRVVSTADDVRMLLAAAPSLNNGLTLCAGSFGVRCDNDLVAMVEEFGEKIHFAHLRNIIREPDGSFYESEHLEGDNDMLGLIQALLKQEHKRAAQGRTDVIPMRPDHGHLLGEELDKADVRPGYSFAGRLKGLAELRGIIHTLNALSKA